MPPTRSILYVFLASPGGLEAERRLARNVVEEVNRTFADRTGWQIELLGWEDTIPGYGRPQALINQDVDRCDIFLGLLHKRWGQSTGDGGFTSGFAEEFERALNRRRETDSPDMILVFKRIDDTSDPGDQLRQVLEFREEQIQNKELLFKEVADADEWERSLRVWISRAILDRYGGTPEPQTTSSASQEGSGPNDADALGGAAEHAADARPIPSQIAELALRANYLAGEEGVDSFAMLIDQMAEFDIVRLHLAAQAALAQRLSSEVLDVHDLNRVYLHRSNLETSFPEDLLLIRTLGADSADVVPGWYWAREFDEDPVWPLLYLGMHDRSEVVRSNSLKSLAAARVDPDPELREHVFTSLLREESPFVQNAALSYIGTVATADDIPLISSSLEAGSPDAQGLHDLVASIRAKVSPNATFLEALEQDVVSSAVVDALAKEKHHLDEPALRRGLHHHNAEIRRISASVLLDRGLLNAEEARKLSEDKYRSLRALGFVGLARSRERLDPDDVRKAIEPENLSPPPNLFASLALGNSMDVVQDPDNVVFEVMRGLPKEQVVAALEWYGNGHLAYRVLSTDYFEEEQHRLRHDMGTDFEAIKRARDEKLVEQFGEIGRAFLDSQIEEKPEVEEFVRLNFAAAALAGIAAHGVPEDVAIARPYLSATYDFVKAQAVKIVARFGDPSDVDQLLELAKNSYGALQQDAARAAVALGWATERDPIPALLKSDDIGVTLVAIQEIINRDSTDYVGQVRALLHHEKDRIRVFAVAALARQLTSAELAGVLNEYPHERGSYYYNVVCWLDRLLFAPEPFATAYRSQLREIVETRRT